MGGRATGGGAGVNDAVEAFRAQFPALRRWAWFDTPGCGPAAAPVAAALEGALQEWLDGGFSWKQWDAATDVGRERFAELAGVRVDRVAALGSAAEGAATVARSLPPGRILVGADEFRSMRFPWLVLDPERNPVTSVAVGADRFDRLIEAITDNTVLVVASDTLTADGAHLDAMALRAGADRVGARLLLDLTQSFGILDHRAAMSADYVLVHGYKWLLCPRGAAWLVLGDGTPIPEPLLPSWKSTPAPYGYFGGDLSLLAPDAAALNTSPAWLSWIGAVAALELRLGLDSADVHRHTTALAAGWRDGVEALGLAPLRPRGESHIGVVDLGERAPAVVEALAAADVKATVNGTVLRVGVHYFTTDDDVQRCLAAIAAG